MYILSFSYSAFGIGRVGNSARCFISAVVAVLLVVGGVPLGAFVPSGVAYAEVPTVVFSPVDGGYMSAAESGDDVTVDFSGAVYADSACTAALDGTSAGGVTDVRLVDSSGTAVSHEVSYDGAEHIISLDPDASFSDGVVYVGLSDGWYYDDDGTCTQGAAGSASFTVDTVAPSIVSHTYGIVEGGESVGAVVPGTVLYTRFVFSEAVKTVVANNNTARPDIRGKTDTSAVEKFRYDIVATGTPLASGDCAPDSANTVFTCRYDLPAAMTGTNVFKAFAAGTAEKGGYEDLAGNSGARQTFSSSVAGVIVAPVTAPTFTVSPANHGSTSNVGTNVTLTANAPIYDTANGTAFTNSTIDDAVTLGTTKGGNDIPFDATVSGSTITVNPTDNLSDGWVYLTLSGWHFGSASVKFAGTERSSDFIVSATHPRVVLENVSGGYVSGAEDDGNVPVVARANGDVDAVKFSFTDGTDTVKKTGAYALNQVEKISSAMSALGLSDNIGIGEAVALDGDMLAIGSELVDGFRGGVWLITDSDKDGQFSDEPSGSVVKISNATTGLSLSDSARFGTSVALDAASGTLAVGAIGENGRRGTVYLIDDGDDRWASVRAGDVVKLNENTAGVSLNTFDHFGSSVALDGDTLAVGVYGDDVNGNDRGAVYLIDDGDDRWASVVADDVTKLSGNTSGIFLSNNDYFGSSVALDGSTIAVGATGDSTGAHNAGAVHILNDKNNDGDYADSGESVKISNSTTGISVGVFGALGSSVSLDGGLLATGVYNDHTGGDSRGAVYIIGDGGDGWASVAASDVTKIDSNTAGLTLSDNDFFGGGIELRDGILAVGASGDDTGGRNRGVVYLFHRNFSADLTTGDFEKDGTPTDDSALGAGTITVTATPEDAWGNTRNSVTGSFIYDPVAPTVSSALWSGSTVQLILSDSVYGSPGAADFTVKDDGTAVSVSSVTLLTGSAAPSRAIRLNLASAPAAGSVVKVYYTQNALANRRITDRAGNAVPSIPEANALTARMLTAVDMLSVSFTPAIGEDITSLSADISVAFGGTVYADSICAVPMDAAAAERLTVLKRTNAAGAAIARTVSYTDNTIVSDPTADFTEGDVVYAAVSDDWHYKDGNGACLWGRAYSATFVVDTIVESVSVSPVSGGFVNAAEDSGSLTVSGSSQNLATGTTVTVAVDGSDTGTAADFTKTDTLDSSGNWSVTITAAQLRGLGEGTVTITASAAGVTATGSFVYDKTAPTIDVLPVSDGYVNNAEDDDPVLLFADVSDDSASVSFTVTDANNTPTVTVNGSRLYLPISVTKIADAPPALSLSPLDLFGSALYGSGSKLYVGAPGDNDGKRGAGAVYILNDKNSDGDYTDVNEVTKISDNTSGVSLRVGDGFGSALSVSGSKLYVGASGDDDGGRRAGAVYILNDTNSDGDYADTGERTKLSNTTEGITLTGNDFFGSSLFVDGSKLYVGAFGDDAGGRNAGAVYILEDKNNDGDYADTGENIKLSDDTGGISLGRNQYFGSSVFVDGSKIYVGAVGDDDGAINAGAVYILEDKNADGDYADTGENVKISNSTAGVSVGAHDAFGSALFISGDNLYVGARSDDDYGPGAGTIYILNDRDRDGDYDSSGEFMRVDTDLLDIADDAHFGSALFVSGSTVHSGAVYDTADGARKGSVFSFTPFTGFVGSMTAAQMRGFDEGTVSVSASVADWAGNSNSGSGTFIYDTDAPSVSAILYRDRAVGGHAITHISPTDTVYSIISFDEAPVRVESGGFDARPGIFFSGTDLPYETQYDIVSSDAVLKSGECQESGTGATAGKKYLCKYTGSGLKGSNLFKSYVRTYADAAGNVGTAQTYATNSDGVIMSLANAPVVSFSPLDGDITIHADIDIVVHLTAPIYRTSSGTAFTNTTIDDIITLKSGSADGTDIGFDARMLGNTITITTDNDLIDGEVYVGISDGWYYGTNPIKSRGFAKSFIFTVDTTDPTLLVLPISGGSVTNAEDESTLPIFITTSTDTASVALSITDTDGFPVVSEQAAQRYIPRSIDAIAEDLPKPPSTFDLFGFSLAQSGSTLYVGAPGDGGSAGAVYVLEDTNSDGDYKDSGETVVINNDTGGISLSARDGFGSSVAVSGSKLYVGASSDSSSGGYAGAVYILEDKNSDGDYADSGENVKLSNATGGITLEKNDYFGSSVAVSGSKLYVGAFGDDDGAADAGAVYILEDKNSDGDYADSGENVKLSSTTGGITLEGGDYFGSSVAVSGSKLYVGASGDDDGYHNAGALYILNDTNSDGDYADDGEMHKIGGETAGVLLAEHDHFGSSVALSGSDIYVGAYGADYGGYNNAGSLYVLNDVNGDYRFNRNGEFVRVSTEELSLETSHDLGSSVAVSGSTIYVGARGSDAHGESSGAVYSFTTVYGFLGLLTPAEMKGFDDGVITASVTATDGAGNTAKGTGSYLYDSSRPSVSSVTYKSREKGGSAISTVDIGSAIYSFVSFSEPIGGVIGSSPIGRPVIKAQAKRGNAVTVPEFTYSIITGTAGLGNKECRETGSGVNDRKEYTCRYSAPLSLTGDNLFKTYVTLFSDSIGNNGTAQTYRSLSDGVTIRTTTLPTAVFTPVDGAHIARNDGDITITMSGGIYGNPSGKTVTSKDLSKILTLAVGGAGGTDIPFTATINNDTNVITIDPTNALPEETVYVALSDGWYYGAWSTKARGTAYSASFTVDTIAPTVTVSTGGSLTARTVRATDADTDTTVWKYKVIDASVTCDSAAMTSGSSDYTEGTDLSVTSAAHGKKVCFASTDATGNTGYAPTSILSVLGGEPTKTWTPGDGASVRDASADITLVFSSDPYSDSSCASEFTDTTADARVTLGTTDNGDDVAKSVSYAAADDTVTIDPTADLPDGTYYASLSGSWHYRNGACAQGSASKMSFTVDTIAPAAPTALDLAAADDLGAADDDDRTNKTSGLTVSGCAEAGSTVELLKDGASFVPNVHDTADTTAAACTGGTKQFSADISLDAQTAAYAITAKAYDTAGNASAASSALDITVDTVPPHIITSIGGSLTARTVSAKDTETGASSWKYKVVDASDTCDSTEMATGTSDYTEDSDRSVASADNGRKVCFAATDSAGNIGYAVTGVLSVAGAEPTKTWTPAKNAKVTDNTIDVTLVFSADVYSDSGCTTEMTDTTAGTRVKLGTTNGGNDVAKSVSYDAATDTITMDPTDDLPDGTYYAFVQKGWHYKDGACASGSESSISFTVDATAPTVSKIEYEDAATGSGSAVSNAPLTGSFYTIVSFSENVAEVAGDGAAARPKIVYRTSSSANEVQYDIIADDGTLATGDCKAITGSSVYACKYTGTGLSGTNLFKTYATAFTDGFGNAGTAQTYTSNTGGVTLASNAEPSISFTPANGAITNDASITVSVSSTGALYSSAGGTAFTDTTVDNIVVLKTTNADGADIPFNATISGTTITIDPDNDLSDGMVYVGISDGWYYGANPVKTRGSASNASFTVDSTAPVAPTGLDLAAADDSADDDDDVTDQTSGLTISGCAESGVTVELLKDGASFTTKVTDVADTTAASCTGGTKQFSADIALDARASAYAITAKATDAAGNVSPASAALDITVDTTAPVITASVGGELTARTVKGVDNDSGTTIMKYKLIGATVTCDSAAMATGSSDYTEDTDQSVPPADNGKKACFSSADVAGNTSYAATAVLSSAGTEPTRVWSPTDRSSTSDVSVNVTHDFSSFVYSNSTCGAELTSTTAADVVTLGTTNGGDDVAKTVSYDAATDTITMDPTSDLADDTYYASVSGAWYYKDGACASGSESTISFTVDTAAPSAPTGLELAASDDTGSSDTDNLTNRTTGLTVSGCAESGATVELLKDGASFSTKVTDAADTADASCTGGTRRFSADINLDAQAGAYAITAKATDVAGNTSVASGALDITVETTAPTVTPSIGGTLTARTVKGVDDDSGTTSWQYKVIGASVTCGSDAMTSGSSDYTEDTDQSVTPSAHGKKVCFSSTDTAGNTGYAATGTLSVLGEAPTATWTPTDGSHISNNAITVTHDFSASVYSDNTCGTELTDTTAGTLVKLGTTDGGDDVAKSVSYNAATDMISIDPTDTLADDTYYASVSNAWHYRNGACAQGTESKISFTVDTVTPTITATVSGTLKTRKVKAVDDDSGTTTMKYKVITATATCDSTEMATGTTDYTEDTDHSLTPSDNGKKICFSSTDPAGNTGYTATAVLSVAGAEPKRTWTPADNGATNKKAADITLKFSADIYSDNTCTTELTDTTATAKITFGDYTNGNNIAKTATYDASKNTITINPTNDLTDGIYHAALSADWYYRSGACTPGSAENISFAVDTVAPTVTITTPIGGDGYVNAWEDNSNVIFSGTSTGLYNGYNLPLSINGVGAGVGTTVPINASGNWSFTIVPFLMGRYGDGTVTITATPVDRAGNTSTETATFIYDTTGPALSSAIYSGSTVTLTMTESVYGPYSGFGQTAADDFQVTVDGSAVTVSSFDLPTKKKDATSTVTLTLASPIPSSATTVTVGYQADTMNEYLMDVAGNKTFISSAQNATEQNTN